MTKDDPIIGLYGIDGVYNYGCEAIVRGIETILRKKWPDIQIKYVSSRSEDDKKRLKGSNVEIIPQEIKPLWTPSRLNGILAHNIGFNLQSLYREDLKWINDCDAIFSIGGDIYSLPPGVRDNNFRPYYNWIVHFGDLIKKKGKKLIIWGASIGPFEDSIKAKNTFTTHLKKVDLITSREPETTSYLKSLGIQNNVMNSADPAFTISAHNNSTFNKNKLHIGINLSPVSSIYASGEAHDNNIIVQQADMITTIIKKFDAEIVLIPHVICDFNINDDDLRYLRLVKEQLPQEVVHKVNLIDQDIGFMGVKNILNNCNVVIAARMHCAINALELGIPSIFLAYSQKAIGMARYVYGDDKWAIPLNTTTNDIIVKSLDFILQKEEYFSNFLNKRIVEIRESAYGPLNKLEGLIG